MFKKIMCLLLLCPIISFANVLPNYAAVKDAIEHGQAISVTMNFSKCTPKLPFNAYYSPRSIMILSDALAFSQNHTTRNNPQFPHQAIIENVRYTLKEEGILSITTLLLDPSTFAPKDKQPPIISCKIGDGVQFYHS